jgi:membrane-associated protease RseP (regulator of RpoE activity)
MNRHLVLFLLTVVTTTVAGADNYLNFASQFGAATVELTWWQAALRGFWFSVPFLGFLTAHEFGHYGAARWHGLRPSLPYFLPVPLPLTGSLGAVIFFRGRFPNRRVLFDFAAGGPFAGFVVALIALVLGLHWSPITRLPQDLRGMGWLGEPLLFQWLSSAIVGPIPDGSSINLHPTALAGWFGLLFTMLNLFPIGQLDGGHITYAVLRRPSRWVTLAGLALVAVLIVWFRAYTFTLWLVLLVVMIRFIGWEHPAAEDDELPLDPARLVLAALIVAIFVVCFVPVPISELVSTK